MSADQSDLTEELELVWFRQIVERAPDAIVVIDSEGRIILMNRQTERLFGYPRDEVLGKAVETLVPDQLRDGHAIARDAYFVEPKVREIGANLDLSGRRKDGSEFPIEISLSPLDTPRLRSVTPRPGARHSASSATCSKRRPTPWSSSTARAISRWSMRRPSGCLAIVAKP